MRASIIIPTYNRESILALTLDSLCQQSGVTSTDYEVIICDDGSSDNTHCMVKEYTNRLTLKYFYQEDEGYRVAKARNMGIKAASGDTIILVDAGVCASRNFVSSHLACHESGHAEAAVIGYIYGYNYTMRSNDLTDDFDFSQPDTTINTLSRKGEHLDIRENNYQLVNDQLHLLKAPWCLFWTTNVSFRKKTSENAGLFNELFTGWGVEDIELGYRLWKNGCVFTLSREASALHYPHERDITKQKTTNLKNRELFFKMHPDEIVGQYMQSTALGFNLSLHQ